MLYPRFALLALVVPLGGVMAAPADRGVNNVHQPVVEGDRAYVPGCPDWHAAGRDSAAMTDSNYGCATSSNLAAMIANPADLLHGRAYAGTDAETATRAIKAWRDVAPTGSKGVERVSTKEASGGGQ